MPQHAHAHRHTHTQWASWNNFFILGLHFWCPGLDAPQQIAVVADKREMSLITSKHSENLNFTLFHPSEWLWHTFVYLCPALKSHFLSDFLFPATHILHRSGLLSWAPSNQFCHYLTHDALKTPICAFIPSHIDYCNSLFTGFPKIWTVSFRKFKTMLPTSTVVLPGLTTYLWFYVLYTGFLLSPAFPILTFKSLNN